MGARIWDEPHFVRQSGLCCDGEEVQYNLKGIRRLSDGRVFWELRQVLEPLHVLTGDYKYLHRWLRQHSNWWFHAMNQFGLLQSEHFLESLKAYRQKKREEPALVIPEDARQEYIASTSAVVALCVGLQAIAKTTKVRRRAQAMVRMLFQQLLPQDVLTSNCFPLELEEGRARQCPFFDANHRGCVHTMAVRDRLMDQHGGPPQQNVSDAFAAAASAALECPAAMLWAAELMSTTAPLMDRRLEHAAYTKDVQKALPTLQMCDKRKRRVDEDLRNEIVKNMRGRVRNTQAGIRAVQPDLDAEVAGRWDEKYLLQVQAAGWEVGAGAHIVHVSLDGKRVGQPKEETLVFASWVLPQDVGSWMPPVVPGIRRACPAQIVHARAVLRRFELASSKRN